MVVTSRVTVDSRRFEDFLGKYSRNLPKYVAEGGQDLLRYMATQMKATLTRHGNRDKGTAYDSIRVRVKSRNRSELLMSQRAIYLDRMKPHFVSLKRGRMINRWVKRKYGTKIVSGKSRVRRGPRGGVTGGFLYVTPHPFINENIIKGRDRFPKILRKKLDKARRISK